MRRLGRATWGVLWISLSMGCSRAAPFDVHYPPLGQLERTHQHAGEQVPDPERSARVSLHGILAYADENAPAIEVGTSTMAQADAERAAAAPLLPADPTLSLGAGPRRGPNGTAYDVEVSLQQRFEIAGQRGQRLHAAKSRRALTVAQIEEVRWSVHLQVHTAFHVALVARERVTAADRLFAFAEKLLEIAQKRHKAGDISPLHVRVAEGELAQAKQQKIRANAAYQDARLALAELSGWPTDRLPEPAGSLDRARHTPGINELVDRGLASHPTARRLEASSRDADAQKQVADRDAWPDVTVGVTYLREQEATTVGTESQHIGMLGLSIPIPIFQRNRGARARAAADLHVAQTRTHAFRRTLQARVTRSATAVNAAADRLDAYGTTIIPTFEENLRLLGRAFELGEIEILEVLVARGRFLDLQQDALSAYEDYFRAIAALEGELGTEVWTDEHHVDEEKEQ